MLNTELLLWCNGKGNVHLSCFVQEMSFFWQICFRKWNCLFTMKRGVRTNLNMLNLMVMLKFYLWTRNTLFGQDEAWWLDYFEYGEFDYFVVFSCFVREIHILGKFSTKKRSCLFFTMVCDVRKKSRCKKMLI